MAENEKLDLAYYRSGRWQKWRDSIANGKSSAAVAEEGVRCIAQTVKNLQTLSEEGNEVPIKQVLMAATGEDGSFDEIMRKARFGRDYLQLFASQSGQQLDERTIVENVMTLTADKFLDQIGQDVIGTNCFPDAKTFREFELSVKDQMIDDIQALSRQLVEAPDSPLRMPNRSAAQKEQHQVDLLNMSIGVQEGNEP